MVILFSAFLLVLSSVAIVPQQAQAAETWPQYLSRMWSDCETKFNGLDKTTGLVAWDGTSTQPVTGDGTSNNPYLINSPAELRWVCSQPENALKSFKLLNDLDLGGNSGHIWSPTALVNSTEPIVMDGNGHIIYNMKLYGSTNGYLSLIHISEPTRRS